MTVRCWRVSQTANCRRILYSKLVKNMNVGRLSTYLLRIILVHALRSSRYRGLTASLLLTDSWNQLIE